MSIQTLIESAVKKGFSSLYKTEIPTIEFQATRKEFEGDITVVVFPMLRYKKGNPVQIGNDLGNYIVENVDKVLRFNVVKGFLNLVIDDALYLNYFNAIFTNKTYGFVTPLEKDAILVEYSSPNTNKPLHLGHVRNNLLGYSVAEIIKAAGKKVYKTQIINDRGIHICKSMLAWQKENDHLVESEKDTPKNTGTKGDKLVGNYYVKFETELKRQSKPIYKKLLNNDFDGRLIASNAQVKAINNFITNSTNEGKIREQKSKLQDIARKRTEIMTEAQEMLYKWETGNQEVVNLWKEMNSWVYAGFETTYKNLGVNFDSYYYESNTYLLGKNNIEEGLKNGVFFKKEDGSVWIDLTKDGLDEKIVLRSDGTAVYMTQDIGTAIQRSKDYPNVNGMVYTVGNEQDYHFRVLFLILKKLGYSWANQLFHLSYGMVDLPSGKMKSREGTVVDADELMLEMTDTARALSQDLGKLEGYSEQEKENLYKTIGLGALKYYILKVDPKKRILFNPKESVDFQGNTGPFIQYTYARIQSILRKATFDYSQAVTGIKLHQKEKELIKIIENYPEVIQQAAANHSPALIANYTYDLVKEFNSFYQNVSILGEENQDKKIIRVQLSQKVSDIIKSAFSLLGISMPERM